MESVTRPRLSAADITRLVREGMGDVGVVGHEEFTDGYFNAAHAVRLADGREVVLKVAPSPGVKVLRYEVDLMRTEIEFIQRASIAGVPLPHLWHSDPDRGVIIMERLRGKSFELAKKAMTPAQVLAVRRELSRISVTINSVTGERFGYPRRDGRTRSATWSTSFRCFIDDILTDATETERPLPRTAPEIRDLVARCAPLLDEVTVPALIHFDLWDGNVFVAQRDGDWYIEGLIDGERAFYGDPIAELVSLVSFVPQEEWDVVVDGYLGRPLSAGEQARLYLYRVYLWLILLAETAVRGYPDEHNALLLRDAGGALAADLDKVEDVL